MTTTHEAPKPAHTPYPVPRIVSGFVATPRDIDVVLDFGDGSKASVGIECADNMGSEFERTPRVCKGGAVSVGLPAMGEDNVTTILYTDDSFGPRDLLAGAADALLTALVAVDRLEDSNRDEFDRLEKLADEQRARS